MMDINWLLLVVSFVLSRIINLPVVGLGSLLNGIINGFTKLGVLLIALSFILYAYGMVGVLLIKVVYLSLIWIMFGSDIKIIARTLYKSIDKMSVMTDGPDAKLMIDIKTRLDWLASCGSYAGTVYDETVSNIVVKTSEITSTELSRDAIVAMNAFNARANAIAQGISSNCVVIYGIIRSIPYVCYACEELEILYYGSFAIYNVYNSQSIGDNDGEQLTFGQKTKMVSTMMDSMGKLIDGLGDIGISANVNNTDSVDPDDDICDDLDSDNPDTNPMGNLNIGDLLGSFSTLIPPRNGEQIDPNAMNALLGGMLEGFGNIMKDRVEQLGDKDINLKPKKKTKK